MENCEAKVNKTVLARNDGVVKRIVAARKLYKSPSLSPFSKPITNSPAENR